MRRIVSIAALVAFAAPVAAQPEARTIDLENSKFVPAQIQLRVGTPIVLLLKNGSSGGHNFHAPAFFAAVRVDPASAALIHDGRIEVPAHATGQVSLTPAEGQYPLKCTHPFHSTFGMKGTIVVH